MPRRDEKLLQVEERPAGKEAEAIRYHPEVPEQGESQGSKKGKRVVRSQRGRGSRETVVDHSRQTQSSLDKQGSSSGETRGKESVTITKTR